MLQQTQVQTVVPYFYKFIERFPDISSLANAALEDVLALWAGLGYYSRARNLHKGARFVQAHFDGHVPREIENLLTIPGVGRYTAGAIASIAFGERAPIVDGNVKRVFARFFGIRSNIDTPRASRILWRIAQDWVDRASDPGDLNQAMMELGEAMCIRSQPKCHLCPIRASCIALKAGVVHRIPRRTRRKPSVALYWAPMVYTAGKKIYLEQNPDSSWWKGMWDLPRKEFPSEEAALRARDCGKSVTRLAPLKHTVTNHRIHLFPYWIRKQKVTPSPYGRWFDFSEVNLVPTSSLVRKVLRHVDLV